MAGVNSTEIGIPGYNSSAVKRYSFTTQLDSYGLHIRIPFIMSACLCMCVTVVSLVAFTRTRQTPKTARFLSTALLVFDLLTTLSLTLRKLTSDTRTNILFQFIGVGWSFLAYINIGLMSVERLVVFQWPNFYLRYVTYTVAKVSAFVTWTLYILFYVIFNSLCISKDDFKDFAICLSKVTVAFIQVTFPTVVFLSSSCFLVIILIVRKQVNKLQSRRAHITRMYRSTLVVFLCLLNFLLTTSLYLVFSMSVIDVDVRRLIFDALTMINELVDTCSYVLWYKECRMELLKICSFFYPKLQQNIDRMRVTIFNIVTYDRPSYGHEESTSRR